MVQKQKNIVVVLGDNPNFKKFRIDKIKRDFLKNNPDARDVHFFPQEISLIDLQKEIENLSFTKRVFVFKSAENLSEDIKKYLLHNLKSVKEGDLFIFDLDSPVNSREKLQKDKFFSFLFRLNPPHKIGGKKAELSFRDLAIALRRNSIKDTLVVMSSLFKTNPKHKVAMPMLGLIVKMLTGVRDPQLRSQYVHYLFEADRLVKEGILDPRRALEFLILKVNAKKIG